MLHLAKIGLIILFFNAFLFSQTIQDITVSGNENFSDDTYLGWCGYSTGVKYFNGILDSIKTNIASNLASNGYLHSNFDGTNITYSNDSSNVTLNLSVQEGDPTYINSINFFNADSTDSVKVLPAFDFLNGQIYSSDDIKSTIMDALTYYENNGYPFAKILVASVYFYQDSSSKDYLADIDIKIDKGNAKSKIDKIEIVGNTKTKDYVILRELRIKEGEEYSEKLVEELPKRLNKLRYFEPVNKPQYYLNKKNEGVLVIEVKEKETNNFDGILGYIPPQGNEKKGYLTGLVDVSLRNLFGTGRAAAIHWQQFDRYSQELQLKYLEPWFLGYPFNLNGELYQRKQDSSYVQRSFTGSIEYLATEDISASLLFKTEAIIPTEGTNSVFTVFNSSSLTTGLSLKIDTRDDPYAPTEGFLFINSYSFSNKKIYGPAKYLTSETLTNINLQRFELNLNLYYELFSKQVAALGLHGRELRGPFLEQSDLYRLGGTNSLRGYREDQFLGSRIFWSNLEYRFLLAKRSFAFLFFDTGYYLRKGDLANNIPKAEGFKYGYGLGLDVETGLGVLSVSYALAKGGNFSDGLIHFGLINEF